MGSLYLILFACNPDVKTDLVNTPPQAAILSPEDGSSHALGDTVAFAGQVSDDQQSEDSLLIAWKSDIDGVFNTDPATATGQLSFETGDLSEGSHLITLLVTDDDGEQALNMIVVGIEGEESDADADADADSDADGDSDADSDPSLPTGGSFCVAGGAVSDGDVSGVFCLGPAVAASGSSFSDGTVTWQPGPVVITAP